VVIDTTDPCGWGREEEREQLTTFLGNVNSSIEKLFAVCSSPMRKNPPYFLCSKKLGSPASETSTIGTQRSTVTLSKKRKQKKIEGIAVIRNRNKPVLGGSHFLEPGTKG